MNDVNNNEIVIEVDVHERRKILRRRREICDLIYEIEKVYKNSSEKKKTEYDKQLLYYGALLEKLVLPRRTVTDIYQNRKVDGKTWVRK